MRIEKDGLLVFPDDYNPILVYHEKIQNGEIVVSNKIKQVIKHLVFEIENEEESEYYLDSEKGMRPITFIENFVKHFKGKLAGKPFILDLWQQVIVFASFGFIHKEKKTRRFKEIILIIGRKNGKSSLSAAIALYLLYAEGESSPSLVSVATQREQAKIIFDTSKRYIKHSDYLRKYGKTLISAIETPYNDGVFKPLASDSNSLDGLDLNGVFIDELHAIKDKGLYDVVVDGCGAREEPIIFVTTTSGTQRNGIYDLKYDEAKRILNGYKDKDGYTDNTILPFVYELDDNNEWKEEEMWEKANPALDSVKNRDTLKEKVHRALHNPLLVNNLLTKEFNVPTSSEQAWLNFDEYNNETKFSLEDFKGSYGIGGVDLSKTTDLTAATMMFKKSNDDNIYFETMYWLPSETLEIREQEDKVPYKTWVDLGLLRVSDGSIVDYKDVTSWFVEMREKYGIYTLWVGFDAWAAGYWTDEMSAIVGRQNMIEIRQGSKTLSHPMQELEALFKSKKVIYNNNPLSKWNLSNVHVEMDNNGNIKPTKARRGKRQRIDGFASMLNAYVVYLSKENDYNNLIK